MSNGESSSAKAIAASSRRSKRSQSKKPSGPFEPSPEMTYPFPLSDTVDSTLEWPLQFVTGTCEKFISSVYYPC